MSDVTLRAETGRRTGTRPSRRLRRSGKVPATLYGQHSEPLSIAVEARDLRRALTTEAGINALITLEVEGEKHTSLARQLQRHPTKGDVIHLDFVKISLTDRVDVVVAVETVGEPEGVREGGIIETVSNSVNVNTLVTSIPDSINVDISGLGVGDALRVSDLPAIEGLEYLDDPLQTIVTVSLPSAALAEGEAEEADEEEEAAEDEQAAEGEDAGEESGSGG